MGDRLLVLDVVARDQPVDAARRDAEAAPSLDAARRAKPRSAAGPEDLVLGQLVLGGSLGAAARQRDAAQQPAASSSSPWRRSRWR